MKSLIKYAAVICMLAIITSCSKSGQSDSFADGGSTGIGGSLARFTINNNHLYTVSNMDLSIFDITDASNPIFKKKSNIGWGVETIFPRENNIFIGTQTGMKIMDVSTPTDPVLLSSFQHIRSCDPVVADDKYAYITLRNGNACTRGLNEMQIIDISNLQAPKIVKTYPMNNPQGLALEGNNLFICDNVIKWYDVSDPLNIVSKGTFIANSTDIIAHNGILMVIGTGGLSQYTYNTGKLELLSRIPTTL